MQLSEQQISNIGRTWGLGFFIAVMLWIIWDLARKPNAGKFGAFILFYVLAFGIFGVLTKNVLQWLLEPCPLCRFTWKGPHRDHWR